jgi:hypothetical protein
MAALFAEPPGAAEAVSAPANFDLLNASHRPVDDINAVALAVRIAVEAAIPYERLDRAVIDTPLRERLDTALNDAPVTQWIRELTSRVDVPWAGEWAPLSTAYTTHSGLAIRRWRGAYGLGGDRTVEVPGGGQVSLQLPGAYPLSGRVALVVDATFQPGPVMAAIDEGAAPGRLKFPFREKLSLQDLHSLFLALIQTALKIVAPAVFPAILGVPVWQRIGPTGYMYTFLRGTGDELTGIGRYVDLEHYANEKFESNLDLQGANPFYVPRTASFETLDERTEVVKGWLTRLLLDMGLEGFEADLAAM